MPWLADLVESSEGSLDVLPVQCLCEFLLHDVPPEGFVYDEDDDKSEQQKKKQVSPISYPCFYFHIAGNVYNTNAFYEASSVP